MSESEVEVVTQNHRRRNVGILVVAVIVLSASGLIGGPAIAKHNRVAEAKKALALEVASQQNVEKKQISTKCNIPIGELSFHLTMTESYFTPTFLKGATYADGSPLQEYRPERDMFYVKVPGNDFPRQADVSYATKPHLDLQVGTVSCEDYGDNDKMPGWTVSTLPLESSTN